MATNRVPVAKDSIKPHDFVLFTPDSSGCEPTPVLRALAAQYGEGPFEVLEVSDPPAMPSLGDKGGKLAEAIKDSVSLKVRFGDDCVRTLFSYYFSMEGGSDAS